MRNSIFVALALSTVSSVALAQTPAPTMNKTDSTTAPADMNKMPAAPVTTDTKKSPAETIEMKADSSMGLRVANTATLAVKYVTVSPADFMTSNLLGATVYNNQKESVGEVEDLVIDSGQKVTGVVVSVGGFLGMGQSYVVLDPSTIVINQQDGDWVAYVDTTKETLKNAPKFTYPKSKS